MKKITVLLFLALTAFGCGNAVQQTADVNAPAQNSNDSLVVSSHSGENYSTENPTIVPKSETRTKWKQSGDPIEVTSFNAEIAQAEKNLEAKPNDQATKKALAEAYLKRAIALTDARQYASALGDYRRALKYDVSNPEAKNGRDEIISIYESLNRDYPQEGEEPPPLPFGKKEEIKPANSNEKIKFEQGATSTIAVGNLFYKAKQLTNYIC
ncbi:hypothetical protein BH24ACI2_BH24ACI2_06630 [soil metagenome]|jgi:tetratricopeptide (TPR) repeat protein|nr:hypothetical protein [Acidobacteriota bacterium]